MMIKTTVALNEVTVATRLNTYMNLAKSLAAPPALPFDSLIYANASTTKLIACKATFVNATRCEARYAFSCRWVSAELAVTCAPLVFRNPKINSKTYSTAQQPANVHTANRAKYLASDLRKDSSIKQHLLGV